MNSCQRSRSRLSASQSKMHVCTYAPKAPYRFCACPLRDRLWSVPTLIQTLDPQKSKKILFRVLCRQGVESGGLESGSGNLESGGLESGGLESGRLESRATDFGSDGAHSGSLESGGLESGI